MYFLYFHLAAYTSLPMLPSTCQQLEHAAARDRIAVKNKRRQQPIKEKVDRNYFLMSYMQFCFS
jgi:hypothetical protein